MFKTIAYLDTGNEIQKRAFHVLHLLNLFQDFTKYNPVLCGTIPIAINTENSDLDIIMEVYQFETFKAEIVAAYGKFEGFNIREKVFHQRSTMIINFQFGGFEFELFAQPLAVEKQHAFQHMLIEHQLLVNNPDMKEQVIQLKRSGLKTEPAFAKVLGLQGNPYEELLKLGVQLNVI